MTRSKGLRITQHDEAIVAFPAHLPGAEARQVAGRFRMDRADVYRRRRRLAERGFGEHGPLLHGRSDNPPGEPKAQL